MCPYVCMYVFNFFQGLSLVLRSHDQIPASNCIGPSELCILDDNSEEVHTLQSSDGLFDENSEELHNLPSPDGKNVFLTDIRTLSP